MVFWTYGGCGSGSLLANLSEQSPGEPRKSRKICRGSPATELDSGFRRPTMLRPAWWINPCQPTAAPKPPSGSGWIHEIKHDGFRMIARRDGTSVRLLTRNGNNWSELFPAVVAAICMLKVRSCLIDGEVVVCDEQGLAVFDMLLRSERVKNNAHVFAFDLLELNGHHLKGVRIEERKRRLAHLISRTEHPGLQLCEHSDQPGDVVFAHACKLGCEGIVSKRLGSKYCPGPTKSRDWVKVKNPSAPAVRREAEADWGKRR
jgi:bifunctional non-homologous end joining protein LigD